MLKARFKLLGAFCFFANAAWSQMGEFHQSDQKFLRMPIKAIEEMGESVIDSIINDPMDRGVRNPICTFFRRLEPLDGSSNGPLDHVRISVSYAFTTHREPTLPERMVNGQPPTTI